MADGEAIDLVENMLPELVVLTISKLGELLDACTEEVYGIAEDWLIAILEELAELEMSVLEISASVNEADAEDILAGLELDQDTMDQVVEEIATEVDDPGMVDE